jgi:hypothetical protein
VAGQTRGRLTGSDFHLYVNGVEQPSRLFEDAVQQTDVAVILDTSASTAGELPLLKKAAEKFVARFAPAARIAIYQTGAEVIRLASLSHDLGVLKNGLNKLSTSLGPGSRIYDAIAQAEADLPGSERRRAIVIFTDAVDEMSVHSFGDVERRMLRGNTPLYAVVTRERREPPARNAATGRWAIVFDLASSSRQNSVLLRETALQILDQLDSRTEVMVCDFQRYVRRLRSPTHLQGQPADMWVSPQAARGIVTAMVGTNQFARLGNFDEFCNAENMVVLTDAKRSGLAMLETRMPLERASIVAPAQHDAARRAELVEAMVRRRAETARFLWEQSRDGHQRMTALTRASGGAVAVVDNMDGLARAYDHIFNELRDSYLLGYYHSGEPGTFDLDVRVPQSQVRSRTRVVVD